MGPGDVGGHVGVGDVGVGAASAGHPQPHQRVLGVHRDDGRVAVAEQQLQRRHRAVEDDPLRDLGAERHHQAAAEIHRVAVDVHELGLRPCRPGPGGEEPGL